MYSPSRLSTIKRLKSEDDDDDDDDVNRGGHGCGNRDNGGGVGWRWCMAEVVYGGGGVWRRWCYGGGNGEAAAVGAGGVEAREGE
ncbi:hypothetical protein Tco_1092813 [Tanacetum coccineum]|uniref:Uncharacterized protein n=1 Tax=Tanacetum coccineum TaxID=301880 RepID=A0ABQ5IAY6_9ASTR